MSADNLFASGTQVSAAEMNKKGIKHSLDISAEAALPGQIFYSMANNGAFLKDDIVARNADNNGYVFLSGQKHKHDSDTNAAGGLLSDIMIANMRKLLFWYNPLGLNASDLSSYASGTGAVTLDFSSGAVLQNTGATANSYAVSKVMGVSASLAIAMLIKAKMQYHGNTTNQFVRWGVNMEPMDITNNTLPKFGLESCAATNSNWNIVTSDATLRTAQDAQASLDAAAAVGTKRRHELKYNPGISVDYTYESNIVVSKGTNLPPQSSVPGTIPDNNVCHWSIKSTDTNSKQLYIWGAAVIGQIDDPKW